MKKYLFLLILPLLFFIPTNGYAQDISSNGWYSGYADNVGQPYQNASSVINIGSPYGFSGGTISSNVEYVVLSARAVHTTSTAGIISYYYKYNFISELNLYANASFRQGSYYTVNFKYNNGSYINVNTANMWGNYDVKLYDGNDYNITPSNISVNVDYDESTFSGNISITFMCNVSSDYVQVSLGDYNLRYESMLATNTGTVNNGFRVYLLNVNQSDSLNDALLSQLASQNQTIINQNQQIINNSNKTNENLEDINSSITSEDSPDLDALEDSAGWLPAGPVDSILNLPLTFFNNLISNLSKTCQPVNVPLPYVSRNLTLPCISTLYAQIGATDFLNWVGLVVGTILLYNYFLNLYAWIDKTIQMEDQGVDDWGGV